MYLYRKLVTISSATGAGTDYQVLLKIGATASAVGEDFDLGGNSLNFPAAIGDGGDLRITTAVGAEVPFYVERVTGSGSTALAYVRLKVPDDLSAGSAQVLIYYGDAGAPDVSDPENVYILWDQFDGPSVDATKWNGSSVITAGELINNVSGRTIDTLGKIEISAHSGLVLESRLRVGSASDGGINICRVSDGAMIMLGDTTYQSFGLYRFAVAPFNVGQVGVGGHTTATREMRLKIIGTQYTGTREDTLDSGVNLQTLSVTMGATANSVPFYFRLPASGGVYPGAIFDWVRARKEVASPPTVSAVGAEQDYGVDFPAPPTIDTLDPTDIALTRALAHGEILNTDGVTLDEVGFVFGTTSQTDPGDTAPGVSTYDSYVSTAGTFSLEEFLKTVSGLTPQTTYYIRAYGHSTSYGYGDEVVFETEAYPPTILSINPPGAVLDTVVNVTIYGSYFTDGLTVEIDGETCNTIIVVDENTITCDMPASAISKTSVVTVINPDTKEATGSFFYIEAVSPTPQPGSVSATFSVKGVGRMG